MPFRLFITKHVLIQFRASAAPHHNPLPVWPPRDASVAETPAHGEREQAERVARMERDATSGERCPKLR